MPPLIDRKYTERVWHIQQTNKTSSHDNGRHPSIQGARKIFAVPKCESKLAQIKKEGPILFCDIRNN